MPNTGKNCFRGHKSNIKCARDGARCNSATVYSGHKPTNPAHAARSLTHVNCVFSLYTMLLLKAIVRYIQDGRGVLRAMRMRHGVYMGARRAARTCRTLLRSSGITGTKDVSPARDFARGKSLSQVRLGFCCTRLHPKTQYLII